MAYGTLKVDTITYDNGGSDVDVQVSALAGAGSAAPLNDPDFTGTPTSPTPAGTSNDTSIATTAFVKNYWITKDHNQGGQELNPGEKILTDTSTSAFSLVLPGTPSVGDEIVVADKNGTWNTNNLTIEINANYNADLIAGASTDLVCNVQYATVTLTFTGVTAVGWILK